MPAEAAASVTGAVGVAVVVTPGADAAGIAELRAALEGTGVATVAVDPSAGEDAIRAAIPSGDDAMPAVVIAGGNACAVAVRGASTEVGVRGVVLLSPGLDADARELLENWPGLCLLAIASGGDRDGLADAVGAYRRADSEASDLVLLAEGDGAAAASDWSALCADEEPLAQRVAHWVRTLPLGSRQDDVVLDTEDGWRIHGTRTLPTAADGPVPGVVLLHSGRSDRAIFWQLQRLLARRSIASVSIDWRGRGLSTNRGTYFELSPEQRNEAGLDARAAVAHLRSLPEVDPARVGLVGVVHGAEHAVAATVGDPDIRALVLLTGFMPRTDAERELFGRDLAVYSVTCEGHGPVTESMKKLHAASDNRWRRLRVYPGGAIGYQLFELDEHLEQDVADWLSEVLTS